MNKAEEETEVTNTTANLSLPATKSLVRVRSGSNLAALVVEQS